MNELSELRSTQHGNLKTRTISWLLGIITLCCYGLAVADTLDLVHEYDETAWTSAQTAPLEDSDLAFVIGKGAEEHSLDAEGKLAIILWDERGNDERRSTSHDMNNRPAINLTVVHK